MLTADERIVSLDVEPDELVRLMSISIDLVATCFRVCTVLFNSILHRVCVFLDWSLARDACCYLIH